MYESVCRLRCIYIHSYTYYMHAYILAYVFRQIFMGMHVCMYFHKYTYYTYICTCMYVCMCVCNVYVCTYILVYLHSYICHTRVFSGTIKSLIHALSADSLMTEPTINSTLYTFIEQVNCYDLQKMVLQFAMCFVPTLGYTYMVYTLHN